MLTASVTHVRRTPPLGFLVRRCCPRRERQSELVYGLFYALEAAQLGGR